MGDCKKNIETKYFVYNVGIYALFFMFLLRISLPIYKLVAASQEYIHHNGELGDN